MSEEILKVRDLEVRFNTHEGIVRAVGGISYTVRKGQTLGIIGESGSGKSVSSMAVMGLIPMPPGEIADYSSINFMGRELSRLSTKELAPIRGQQISMIFQDPMTCLNPFLKIETQMIEALIHHKKVSKREALAKAQAMLEYVQVPDAGKRMKTYPHELSGGLRQRVMIAMALTCDPQMIFADEPTTALDVTVQAQILKLFREVKSSFDAGIVLISHDLGVVATECDHIIVMYAGRIVESGSPEEIFETPQHPYTQGLKASIPNIDGEKTELAVIKGLPPDLRKLPDGCAFAERCPVVTDKCHKGDIPLKTIASGHEVRCLLA